MAVEPDGAALRFPPPFVYMGALLLKLVRSGSSPYDPSTSIDG